MASGAALLFGGDYGARQNAISAEASYWLCLPQPLFAWAKTYNSSAKAAMLHVPSRLLTVSLTGESPGESRSR